MLEGFKITEKNMTCRGYKYNIGLNEFDSNIKPCESGFHFCEELKNCFNYYNYTPHIEIYKVSIPEDAIFIKDVDKIVTNKLIKEGKS